MKKINYVVVVVKSIQMVVGMKGSGRMIPLTVSENVTRRILIMKVNGLMGYNMGKDLKRQLMIVLI